MARFGAKRPYDNRETLPIILIISDDSKTAPRYFSAIHPVIRQYCTLRILPAMHHGATGLQLLQYAENEKARLSNAEGVTVWVLVDLEMNVRSPALSSELKSVAVKSDINLLLSQPCFEIWILNHFINTGKLYTSCEQLLQEVKKQWRKKLGHDFPQKKAQADFQKLLPLVDDAISNSKLHDSRNSQSWTEVWKVIEHAYSFT